MAARPAYRRVCGPENYENVREASMFATASYNGEDPESMLDEDGSLVVQFDWEAERVQYRCRKCDTVFPVEEDAEGDPCLDAECTVHTGDENCDDHECEYAGHDVVAEEEPLAWVNSAGVHLDEDKNRVDVTISVGDPRGSFVMSLYKDDDGRIYMEVPYPDKPWLHAELKPVHESSQGFFTVGGVG